MEGELIYKTIIFYLFNYFCICIFNANGSNAFDFSPILAILSSGAFYSVLIMERIYLTPKTVVGHLLQILIASLLASTFIVYPLSVLTIHSFGYLFLFSLIVIPNDFVNKEAMNKRQQVFHELGMDYEKDLPLWVVLLFILLVLFVSLEFQNKINF